jgi:hypothetical protein
MCRREEVAYLHGHFRRGWKSHVCVPRAGEATSQSGAFSR